MNNKDTPNPPTDLVQYDVNGHFEIREGQLLQLLDDRQVGLVGGGQHEGPGNVRCLSVNGVCRSGKLDVACHGDHQFNAVC